MTDVWTRMRRVIALVAIATVTAFGSISAQTTAVDGSWNVTMATSVNRTTDGSLQVQAETSATLNLSSAADSVRGTLVLRLAEVGQLTIELRGTYRNGQLDLDPVGVTGAEGPAAASFRGFHVNGTLANGRLSGEMWSAIEYDGEERQLGPLPWQGEKQVGGTSPAAHLPFPRR